MTTSREVAAGRIVGMFGLRGECKIDATRLGADALRSGTLVRAQLRDGSERELRVRTARMHKGRPLAAFEDFDDITAAEILVGATLTLACEAIVLAPGEYLDADLTGCMLVDLSGVELGRVVGVEHYPSADMLVLGPARTLVPMVSAFVKTVDLGRKTIVVDLPRGLLDDRDADLG